MTLFIYHHPTCVYAYICVCVYVCHHVIEPHPILVISTLISVRLFIVIVGPLISSSIVIAPPPHPLPVHEHIFC